MNFLTILPMAVVMVAGPQLVGAVFLATGDRARRSSIAYLAGAAAAVLAGLTVVYALVRLLKVGGGGGRHLLGPGIDWTVLVLLVVLLVIIFLRRKRSRPPKWMGTLEQASPKLAAKIGLLLFLAMPSDAITMITVAASVARHGRPWWHLLPFVLLTVLLLALPLLCVLLLGRRAQAVLPRIRDWANTHSWVVSELVTLFFITVTISSLLR